MNKYFKHLLALAIVFGLFSCSKDTIEDKEDLVFKEKKLRLEITPHFEQEHIFDFLEVLLDVRSEEDVDVITNINVEKEKTRYSKDNHQFVLTFNELKDKIVIETNKKVFNPHTILDLYINYSDYPDATYPLRDVVYNIKAYANDELYLDKDLYHNDYSHFNWLVIIDWLVLQ